MEKGILRTIFIFFMILLFLTSLTAIEGFGNPTRGKVETLIHALKHNNSAVRQSAADKLGELRAEEAIPALMNVLVYDDDKNVLSAVARALIKIGPPAVPALIQASNSRNHRYRAYATKILENMDTVTFIQVLNSRDNNVRSFAASILQRRGEKAVPALIQALKDNDRQIRQGAIQILGNIGREAAPALPVLIQTLREEDNDIRSCTANVLIKMGEVAVPSLIQALNHKDKLIRTGSIQILGSMGQEAREAIPSLLECLKSYDESIRQYVEGALKQMGAVVVTPLLKAMEDDDKQVQQVVIKILLSLKGNEVCLSLIENLSSNNRSVRNYANAILERKGIDALPSLILAFKGKDAEASQYVAKLILKLDHKESIPALIQALSSDYNGRVAMLIEKIGLPTLPYLIQAQKSNDNQIRQRSAHIVDKFETKDVIPVLLEALKDGDNAVRQGAIESLGKIGPVAKAAVQPLIQIVKEGDKTFQNYAIEALEKIGTSDALNTVRVYRQIEKAEQEAIRAKADAEQKRREAKEEKDAVAQSQSAGELPPNRNKTGNAKIDMAYGGKCWHNKYGFGDLNWGADIGTLRLPKKNGNAIYTRDGEGLRYYFYNGKFYGVGMLSYMPAQTMFTGLVEDYGRPSRTGGGLGFQTAEWNMGKVRIFLKGGSIGFTAYWMYIPIAAKAGLE
jgi:HEAT repeat protein